MKEGDCPTCTAAGRFALLTLYDIIMNLHNETIIQRRTCFMTALAAAGTHAVAVIYPRIRFCTSSTISGCADVFEEIKTASVTTTSATTSRPAA